MLKCKEAKQNLFKNAAKHRELINAKVLYRTRTVFLELTCPLYSSYIKPAKVDQESHVSEKQWSSHSGLIETYEITTTSSFCNLNSLTATAMEAVPKESQSGIPLRLLCN